MAWRNCREVAGREREVRAAGKNATSPTSRPKARAVFVRNASATEVDAPKTTAVEASPAAAEISSRHGTGSDSQNGNY